MNMAKYYRHGHNFPPKSSHFPKLGVSCKITSKSIFPGS